MKLQEAVRIIQDFKKTPRFLQFTPAEVVAVTVLLRLAERVIFAKKSFAAVARAVSGEDELNQDQLPGTSND